MKREIVNKEELLEFYNNHSNVSTAKHFEIGEYILNKWLQQYEIPRHTRQENTKLSNLELYGVENISQLDSVKKKREETVLKHYGVKNISQSEEVKQAKKETTLKNHGVDNIFKDVNYIQKCCIDKLGVYNPSKLSNVTDKIVQTRTLHDSYRSGSIKNKETRVKNYGSVKESYRAQQETYNKTITEKYGSREEFEKIQQQKRIEWCRELYGVDNPFQVPELMQGKMGYKGKDSAPNLKFKSLLESNNLYKNDEESREFMLKNRWYDFKVDNTLIEIDPTATHNSNWSPWSTTGLNPDYHFEKSTLAKENGYRCIHIWDWDDVDKVLSLLLPRLTCYARQCDIREVDYYTSRDFINKYHIQEDTRKNNSDTRLGLFYNDELISIMTFGKPRYNKNYDYELLRYCSSYKVIGGAEKLFKHFLTDYKPESIISYCDLSKFTGDTYTKLGFTQKNISVGKHWYNIDTQEHITDNLLRQRGFDQLFNTNHGKGTKNEQLMLDAGFVEVYDAGQATYVYS